MKKQILRIICALLCLCMLSVCFVSCKKDKAEKGEDTTVASSVNTETEQQTEAETKKTEAELPDVNYGGYKFQILARPVDTCINDIAINEYVSGDVEEKVYERTMYMKETFGIDLVINKSSHGNYETDAMEAILSGSSTYDLIACHGRAAGAYAINNCGYDWNALKWVDLSCDWWTQDAVKSYTIDGAIYFMVGDLSYMKEGQTICMYFNKKLLKSVGIEYPYQMAIDGKWTLEAMKTIALEAYAGMEKSGSGKIEDDSFAYTTGWWRGPMQLLYSTGHRVVTGNSATEFTLDLYNETTIQAYEDYLDNFLFAGACYDKVKSDNRADLQAAFKANRVVFYDDLMSESYLFADVDFGILPWPKYSEDVKGYPATLGSYSNFFVVPRTIQDSERVSVVLEAMSFFGYKNIISVYFDEVLSYKYSPDAESVEVLNLIKDSRVYDFGGAYDFGGIANMGKLVFEAGTGDAITNVYNSLSGIATETFGDWSKVK